MDKKGIDRINELYHKSKSVGLTPEEKDEQTALRIEFIESIRKNMRATLDNVSVVESDGKIVNLRDVRMKKDE